MGEENRAFVRNMVEEEVRRRDYLMDVGEPEVAFTVKLPVSELAMLERVGAYLGHKKTPFASMLLRAAVDDAMWGLIVAEEDNGRGEEIRTYLQEPHELEDGSGSVTRTFDTNSKSRSS